MNNRKNTSGRVARFIGGIVKTFKMVFPTRMYQSIDKKKEAVEAANAAFINYKMCDAFERHMQETQERLQNRTHVSQKYKPYERIIEAGSPYGDGRNRKQRRG